MVSHKLSAAALQKSGIALIVLMLSAACSPVKFNSGQTPLDKALALCDAAKAGENKQLRFTQPRPDDVVGARTTVAGQCTGSNPVVITGGGLKDKVSIPCADGKFSQEITLASGDGFKDLSVSQVGTEEQDYRCFGMDTTPPKIKFDGPPSELINRTNPVVTGTCESGLPVIIVVDGMGTTTELKCEKGKFSGTIPLPNGDGGKHITGTQKDEQGNEGSTPKDYMVDMTPPAVKFTAPVPNSFVKNEVTVRGTCEAGLRVDFGGNVSGSPFTECLSGEFQAIIVVVNPDGVKNITAQQRDPAGNIGRDNRDVVLDKTPPLIQITGPAPGTPAATGVTLIGRCTDGIPVTIGGGGNNAPSTAVCTNGNFSSPVTFTPGDGPKSIEVSQTDPAGNTANDSRSFVRDNTPPAIKITAPAAGTKGQTGLTVSGTCEAGLPVNLGGTGVATPVSTACNGGKFSAPIVFAGADGVKNVVATQTDAVGNIGTDNRNFEKDSAGPAVRITAPAAGTRTKDSITLVGTCETGLQVNITGAGARNPSKTDCVAGNFSAVVSLSNGDGVKNVVASQTDAIGNVGSDNRDFVRDSTAPMIQITAPAANSMIKDTVALVGTCETGLPVAISGAVNAPSTTTCSNGSFMTSVTVTAGDGKKNIIASQTDEAGNTGSDNRDFLRDTTGPAIQITSPAAGSRTQSSIQLEGTCETGLPVAITGAVNAPSSTECKAGKFNAPVTLSTGDGTKNVVVTQTDANGNSGTDNRDFVVSTVGPAIRITGPAAGTRTKSSLTLVGTCETGLEVTIAGSGANANVKTNCVNGAFSSVVALKAPDGVKNITASQTDAIGNTGTDNRDFVLDTTPPVITITGPTAGTPSQSTITLVGACEAGLPVTIGGTGAAAPVTTTCANGNFSAPVGLSNGDGAKNLVASQTDAAGNTGSDDRDFIRDTAPPAIKITAPAVNFVTAGPITLVGTCETGLTVAISGAGITAPATAPCANGSFTSMVTLASPDGTKNVVATQTDVAGNIGSDNRNFILDNSGPDIRITAPAGGFTTQANLTLVGTCEAGLPVSISGAVSAPSTTACSNGSFSAPITLSNGDGQKNVVVSQTDAAGLTGSDNRNFVRDTTAPVIKITAPAAGSATTGNLVLVGTCETGLPVNVSGAVNAPSTAVCTNGGFSTPITVSNGDGVKNVIVSQTDAAGNTGTDNRDFVRDTTGPAIKITAPAENTRTQGPLTLVGTCETGLPVAISGAVNAPSTTACANGAFSAAIVLSNGDGTKNVVVMQTDALGNSGTDNRNFLRDTEGPEILITAPAAGTVTKGPIALVGKCETGLKVDITGGVTAPSQADCVNGGFNANINLASGDGTKNVVVSQTDAIGNTASDNRNFVLDTTPPVIRITAPAAGSVSSGNLTLAGTCETGLPVAISGAVNAPSTTACANGAFSAAIVLSNGDGPKNVVVSQTDVVGNMGSDNRDFVRDTSGPAIKITAPAENTRTQGPLTLVGTCETGLPVAISGAVNAPSTTACANGAFSAAIVLSNGDGTKNVIVSQTDLSGNSGTDNRNFIRDTEGPAIKITAPAAGTVTKGPIALVGSCETGLKVDITGGVTAPSQADCVNGAFNANINLASGDGTKNVVATQTDAIGNSASDNRNFVLDTTAPVIRITAPAAGSATSGALTLVGTCETGLPVNVSGAVNAPSTAVCTNGGFSTSITVSNGDGVKNVIVSQTDAAGNTGTDNRDFVRDTSGPAIKITAPAENTRTQGPLTLVGTCEAGLPVAISGAVSQMSSTPCSNGNFSAAIVLSNGDGVKNVVVTQTDALGNTGSDNRNFVRDTAGPAIKITAPAAGTVTKGPIALVGTCETGLKVDISGGVTAPSQADCVNGAFNANINLASGDGTKNVVASQTDSVGNVGSDNRNFVLDTTAPVIRITAPAADSIQKQSVNLVGTCEAGLTVTIGGAGVLSMTTTNCPNGTFSTNVFLSAGDGPKIVMASQTDAMGNFGSDTRSFWKDTTGPAIQITAPAPNYVTQGWVTLVGTCESNLTVTITGAVANTVTTACTNSQFSTNVLLSNGDGAKNVIASQTDSVGNVGSDNRTFIRDYTAPVIKITAPAVNTPTTGALTLSGTCESGLQVEISGAVTGSTSCSNGMFASTVTLTGADGVKNIVVTQTDAVGNAGTDNRNFVLDKTAPVITIVNPAKNAQVTVAAQTVNGTCETGLAVSITGNIASPVNTACTNGSFTANVTLTPNLPNNDIKASQTDLVGNVGFDTTKVKLEAAPGATETFIADKSLGKVDILFVADNSASMDPEQAALGQKFSALASALNGIDWQIGITTTNCSTDQWGICGSLLTMEGTASTKILTPTTPAYEQLFRNTVQRPETLNCVAKGICPSGNEEGLKAMVNSFAKRASNNAGFFRDDTSLAIVEITDEDEQSTGTATATKPQAVVDAFRAAFGATKKLRTYAITILRGDAACFKQQADQQGGIAAYGTHAIDLATLTGGQSVSICAPDYSLTLNQIGNDLKNLTSTVKLARVPKANTVQVKFTPAQSISWTVSGDVVTFNSPVPEGTRIDVTYEY